MATTVLLEPPTEIPETELPFARQFILNCRFTFATQGKLGGTPVTQSPHEYCLRKWLQPRVCADFDRFAQLIGQHGYKGRFLARVYTYLNLPSEDGHSWRYWISPEAFGDGLIVNRADNSRAPMLGTSDMAR